MLLLTIICYHILTIVNRLRISGTEHLRNLPRQNVLFVSNHQTYFADVITFLHIFCAVKWGKKDRLGMPYYLLNPFTNVYYVAAEETMRATWVSRDSASAPARGLSRSAVSSARSSASRSGIERPPRLTSQCA